MGSILTEIITLLTSGFTTFASGIGSGLNDFASNIFLTMGADGAVEGLSVFGELVIVFSAIALTIGLSRWVLNFITSLGARNR